MNAINPLAREIRMGQRLPELLCPAGSPDALAAAISGGADAIYMGGVAFNARINAKNFTEEELKKGIALAHSFGKKVYIAANTLVFDRELDGFLRSAEHAYLCGADALIVADLGAAAEVKKRIPIELHASTQCALHGSGGVELLRNAGFSRMVCAREMSREDIRSFIDISPLEAEVFVHGALCVCHSGQCLFSSLVGGRSGNRGECAQPCRLPYKGRTEFPLSLKDLTLASHVTELCDLGIASLKIEGRMKSPEYVRDVTRIWRRLLDQRRNATADDIRELDLIFSRGGFTDAYFTKKIGSDMLGIRSDGQKAVSRTLTPFEGIDKKIPIEMSASFLRNEPCSLTVRVGETQTTVFGDVPFEARNAPIDRETVTRCLSKLGDTPYALTRLDVSLDGGLMLPISALNSLRRRATEALTDTGRSADDVGADAPLDRPARKRTPQRTAIFYEPKSIPPSAYSYFDIIYVPLEKYTGKVKGVLLPPVVFDSETETVREQLKNAVRLGATHATVTNAGHVTLAKEAGLSVFGGAGLNVTNNSTSAFYERLGLDGVTLSHELTVPQLRDIRGRTAVAVYGRAPLMVTEKCVGKETGGCRVCEDGRAVLTDRRGMRFPVLKTQGHRSIIFNSVPFYMADKADELRRAGLCDTQYIFTVESAAEADAVITAYKKGLAPKDAGKIKRIK